MSVKLLLNKIRFKRRAILRNNTSMSLTAFIGLIDGAQKEQIIIGEDTCVSGRIIACSKGKVRIGRNVLIGEGSQIRSVNNIIIGENVIIQPGVIISDNNSHPINPQDRLIMQQTPAGDVHRSWMFSDSAPIEIENNCFIGANARICKGIVLGYGTIVMPCSVVTKSSLPNSILLGNPAICVNKE